MGFLDNVIKDSGNEFASKVSDGVAAGDTSSFVDMPDPAMTNILSSISLITLIASRTTSGLTVEIAFPVPINSGISTIIISGRLFAIDSVS